MNHEDRFGRKRLTLEERYDRECRILNNVKEKKEDLAQIERMIQNHRFGEQDAFYRFYHQSFKVYRLQGVTDRIVTFLCDVAECEFEDLHPMFRRIVQGGTGKEFTPQANERWEDETRPIIEAYTHAKHVLDMLVLHGTKLEEPPIGIIEQGWGTVLHVYQIR